MVDKLWLKAKQFMGFDGEGSKEIAQENSSEEDSGGIGGILRFRNPRKIEEDADFEIAVCEPKVYEESLSISSKLRQGSPVIVNLKFLDSAEGTRLIDFICGAAYAINGHMMRIGESIFLFTPTNIAISDIGEKPSIGEGIEAISNK